MQQEILKLVKELQEQLEVSKKELSDSWTLYKFKQDEVEYIEHRIRNLTCSFR
jgi:DNA repair ATPase RecN